MSRNSSMFLTSWRNDELCKARFCFQSDSKASSGDVCKWLRFIGVILNSEFIDINRDLNQ